MVREIVTVQVGQCGNQIGRCFWDLALKEHASVVKDGTFDDAMSSYFRNVETRTGADLRDSKIRCLKARAVLVDTEEGVLAQTLASPLGELFDQNEFIRGVSGAGNNFAHGFYGYGEEYGGKILESVQRVVEKCDSMQAFFLLHSTGGGTGSGLGTKILQLLKDEYPNPFRFTASVLPAQDDDVVTSPYNAAFAIEQLRENADCVFPMDNQALIDICDTIRSKKTNKETVSSVAERLNGEATATGNPRNRRGSKKGSRSSNDIPFDDMNSIAGHMLSNVTSSARFHGKMNVDISELTTNLVPFPKMQFIVSSLSPLYNFADKAFESLRPKMVDQAFAATLSRQNQLLKCDPANGQFLACALFTRGGVNLSDINRNVEKISQQIDMVPWNKDGFKLGHCSVAPVGHPLSILSLSNNTCIGKVFEGMEKRFQSLYGVKRKAFVHHYTQYCEADCFEHVLESIRELVLDYSPTEDLAIKPSRIQVVS